MYLSPDPRTVEKHTGTKIFFAHHSLSKCLKNRGSPSRSYSKRLGLALSVSFMTEKNAKQGSVPSCIVDSLRDFGQSTYNHIFSQSSKYSL